MNLPDNMQCYKMAAIHHGHVIFINLATGADYYVTVLCNAELIMFFLGLEVMIVI